MSTKDNPPTFKSKDVMTDLQADIKANLKDKDDSPPPPLYASEPPAYSSSSNLSSRFSLRGSKEKDKAPELQVDPGTLLPATFHVGTQFVRPLVGVPEIVDHLTFLACLDNLQRLVRKTPTPGADAERQIPGDLKWAAYCERAANRFQAWALEIAHLLGTKLSKDGQLLADAEQVEAVLATADIDILMAWHTYLLNPGTYEQDLDRLPELGGLKALGAFPLSKIAQNIDLRTLTYHRQGPSVVLSESDTVSLPCPRCEVPVNIPLIGHPIEAGGGGGLATPSFTHPCPNCELIVTHSALRAGRYLRDLRDLQTETPRTKYLAGLGRIPHLSTLATVKARERISKVLVYAAWWVSAPESYKDERVAPVADDVLQRYKPPMNVAAVGDKYGWSQELVRGAIMEVTTTNTLFASVWKDRLLDRSSFVHKRALAGCLQRMDRVYNAGNGGFTGVDLGPAIQRQGGFVASMSELGWLDVKRWRDESNPNRFYFLQKAAARYHAFLDLMHAHPHFMLSPTLDIDLGWHTHQLHALTYGYKTRRIVGRFIDHDDAIVDVILKNAYEATAILWAERFHTSYSGCGCPVPPKAAKKLATVQRRSRRPSVLQFGNKPKAAIAGALKGIAAMSADDATPEERAAECPSTHNRKQVHADSHEALKGNYSANHPSPFTKPLGQRDLKDDRVRGGADSSAAMMYAYPYWGVAMIGPWAAYPGAYGVGGGSGGENGDADKHGAGGCASSGNCGTACATGVDATVGGVGACSSGSGGALCGGPGGGAPCTGGSAVCAAAAGCGVGAACGGGGGGCGGGGGGGT